MSLWFYFLFFWRLGARDLWSSHEARAAMNAQGMLDGAGVWPCLYDGRPEVQKPPLYYWVVAALGWLRGGHVDALDVRLPSALSALATVLVLVGASARFSRAGGALLAGLILATGIHFTWLARIGRIDMPLAFTTTFSAWAFYVGGEGAGRSKRYLLAGYVSAAVGVLLKGPIGLALPAAVLAAHLLLEGRWPAFWEWRPWRELLDRYGVAWGLALVLAVVVPVFLLADRCTQGHFLSEFLWHHNVQRGLGGSNLRSHPWWLYGPFFLLYFLPWSPLLLLAFVDRRWRTEPLARFGVAWLGGVLALLSCSRFKRADYLLPAYPGAALFLGCCLARWLRDELWGRWLAGLLALMTVGVLAGWAVQVGLRLPAEEPFRDYTSFAAQVRGHAPEGEPVTFFRTEAHALAFHVGRPLAILLEWQELRDRLKQPGVHFLVAPPSVVGECRERLPGLLLEEVCRNTDRTGRHERPLVLLRARRK